jgi:hypothetical protein
LKGGDISNATPPKIVVLVDVVATITQKEVTSGTGLFKKKSKKSSFSINLKEVSHLWSVGNRFGLSIELAGFEDQGWTTEDLETLMETLERQVSNPFNYAEVYADVDQLVSLLPYRSNLKGVIDLPGRVARYGSYGVELSNL